MASATPDRRPSTGRLPILPSTRLPHHPVTSALTQAASTTPLVDLLVESNLWELGQGTTLSQ
uniref:Uncharacterized protein n=1 Tax=Oryza glumipatula TaxID=40148 RepID=A0A0E0AEX2_9ORYZ